MGLTEILVIAGLVFINGFFVAAEFALVKVRTSQIDQLVEEGNWAAKLTSRALDHLDAYLSASQLGHHRGEPGAGQGDRELGRAARSSRSLQALGIAEAKWLVGAITLSIVPVARALARHVPAHGPRRAGAQEPGDPRRPRPIALLTAPAAGRVLLRLLAGHLAAQQRQQPDPLAHGPGADRPRRGVAHRRGAAAHRRRERRRAATSRAASGS